VIIINIHVHIYHRGSFKGQAHKDSNTQLAPFIYDPVYTNPIDIAQQNEQEFIVERILAHREIIIEDLLCNFSSMDRIR